MRTVAGEQHACGRSRLVILAGAAPFFQSRVRFSELVLQGRANTKTTVRLRCTFDVVNKVEFSFNVHLQECPRGEIDSTGIRCVPCRAGTFAW